jgi:hypothetical protein
VGVFWDKRAEMEFFDENKTNPHIFNSLFNTFFHDGKYSKNDEKSNNLLNK